MANSAGFTINGTPSDDGKGNRSYFASPGELITLELETSGNPKDVMFELYDPTAPGSPQASKMAPVLVFQENGLSSIMLADPDGAVTIRLPQGVHSWIIRSTVRYSGDSLNAGAQRYQFERMVCVRGAASPWPLRKNIHRETTQANPRGVSELLSDLVDDVIQLRKDVEQNSGQDGTVAARLDQLAQQAASAQAAANAAQSTAIAAGNLASDAKADAATADTFARSAKSVADSANTKAEQAASAASSAQSTASTAQTAVATAQSTASTAQGTATSAATAAGAAQTTANTAKATADAAVAKNTTQDDRLTLLESVSELSKILASDFSTNSSSLVNLAGLSVPLVSGKLYRFRFTLVIRTSGLLVSAGLGLNGPANNLLAYSVVQAGSSDSVLQVKLGNAFDVAALGGASLGATDSLATIEGLIRPTAAGNLVPRLRVSVGGTLVVKAGSIVQYTPLGS